MVLDSLTILNQIPNINPFVIMMILKFEDFFVVVIVVVVVVVVVVVIVVDIVIIACLFALFLCKIYNAYWAAFIWPGPILAKYCKMNSSCVIY